MTHTHGALGTAKRKRDALLREVIEVTHPIVTALSRSVTDVFKHTSLESTDDRMGSVIRRLLEVGRVEHIYSRTRHADLEELKKCFEKIRIAWSGIVDIEIHDVGDQITIHYSIIYPKQ